MINTPNWRRGLPVWDPPHNDYYSKPSQPKSCAVDDDALVHRAWSRYWQFHNNHYFWLGRDAEAPGT
jgi:hypothetical protein